MENWRVWKKQVRSDKDASELDILGHFQTIRKTLEVEEVLWTIRITSMNFGLFPSQFRPFLLIFG